MEITFNDKEYPVEINASVFDVLRAQLGENHQNIAVAVNDALVPKALWASHTLQPNDKILVIKAAQGG